jgi:hypothetical protein
MVEESQICETARPPLRVPAQIKFFNRNLTQFNQRLNWGQAAFMEVGRKKNADG